MAWYDNIPFIPLGQSDMPSGAQSQASIFATIGAWINSLARNVPVMQNGQFTVTPGTLNTPVSQAISFASGRFTSPPTLQVSYEGITPQNIQVSYSASTTSGSTVYVNRSGSAGNPVVVHWTASTAP